MKPGTTKIVKWWPRGRRVPKGWRVAKQRLSHHSRYSVLIERVA